MAQRFTVSLCWRRESHPRRAGYTADAGGSVAGSVHLRFLKKSREKSPINCPMARNPATARFRLIRETWSSVVDKKLS